MKTKRKIEPGTEVTIIETSVNWALGKQGIYIGPAPQRGYAVRIATVGFDDFGNPVNAERVVWAKKIKA